MNVIQRVGVGLLVAASAAGALSSSARAADRPAASPRDEESNVGAGIHIGTLGLGPDLVVRLSGVLNLRITGNFGAWSYDDTIDDVDYDVEMDFENVGLLLDWHPTGGEFRFTAGVFYNGNELEGTGVPRKPLEIGDVEFTPEQIGTLSAALDFPETAGYLGFGFGNALSRGSRLTVTLDLGVLFFSEADFSLEADGTFSGISYFQRQLEKEEAEIKDDFADVFKIHPVISLGLCYRF